MVKGTFKMAFTMIELIFAIVVIAITVLSLPIMMQVNSKGVQGNIAQEAIFAASVELMQASTGYWDAHSIKDINLSTYSRVVNISNDCNSTTKLRPGHINQPFHRRCIDDTTITTASNTASGEFTLEDLAHNSRPLYSGNTNGAAGYKKKNLNISLAVAQSSTDNNIKILTATVTDPNNNNKIVTKLYTQTANIGEPIYYKRTF
ncbi:MAG: type II secretion system protein [Epsilonproteobacteria bacterium]|nr:type II secretion system protein [Campylobacterota bacterium]